MPSDQTVSRPGLSVKTLTLTDFRCYTQTRLHLDPGPVILTGPNGAGKTNVLEAISFLVPGRGLRRARLADIARRDQASDTAVKSPPTNPPTRPWGVAATLITPDGAVDVGTGLEPSQTTGRTTANGTPAVRDTRIVHIDGKKARGPAALAAYASCQWLAPQMDRLFLEGPGNRRRFLDRIVYGLDAAHVGRVAAYDHAMRERTKLLRSERPDAGWLSALEETMASKGVAIAAARLDLVLRLAVVCADPVGPFPGALVAISGMVEDWLRDGPALAAEDRLRDRLAAGRDRDRDAGGAGVGPHRSDLIVHHRAKMQPAEQCSTGEQKALLIAMIIAIARLQAAERGTAPLLLLDEVAAHLDESRRLALFDEISALGAQAWLTGTDAALFAPMAGRAQFFAVKDAIITPVS